LPRGVWGIKPRNREQHFAFDALLDDRIKLVTLMGKAGTGKTLMAMAAGLKRTVLDREFRRLVVARPTVSMGRELGFLPGSLEEKLNPWMQPIHDALELLSDLNMGSDHRRSTDLMRSGTIMVEALSYIRGRSIAHQFMVIDEAQNLTPLEVKTIITRVGTGHEDHLHGRPVSNRQSVRGFVLQRIQLHHQQIPRPGHRRAHRAAKRRALRTGRTGGEHFMTALSQRGQPKPDMEIEQKATEETERLKTPGTLCSLCFLLFKKFC
jgi:hypothetical protein